MSLVRRAMTALIGTGVAISLTVGLTPRAFAEDAVVAAQAELTQLQVEAAKVELELQASKQEQASAQREYEITSADLADQKSLVETMRVQVGRVAVAAHQQAGLQVEQGGGADGNVGRPIRNRRSCP